MLYTTLYFHIRIMMISEKCFFISLVYPARSCVAKCRNKECVIHHEKDKCKEEKSCKSQIYNCQQRRPARGCEDDQRCCCRTKEGKMLSCGKNAECADLTYLLFCENPESPCNETRNRKHSKKKKRKKSRIKKSEVDKRNMRNCEINENIRPQKCVITKTSIKCRRRISRNSQIGNTSQTCKRRRTRTPVRSECSQSRNRRKSPRSTRGSRETPSTGRRCLQEEHH
ncbi:hypothetical protein C0J52_14686 [Blattella germanica]|nr:hypothetical protein C0J52_14686 [Blattella germanica]